MSETGPRILRRLTAATIACVVAGLLPQAHAEANSRLAQAGSSRAESGTPPWPIPPKAPVAAARDPNGGRTRIVEFEASPFPYDGTVPGTGKPFFDIFFESRPGRRGARGQVYWEDETYTDQRVLLHVPEGFDIRKPALMVVFFHGHGAKIDRDVRDRQQVAAQIARSNANAVLVAPQFALNAADSSPGAFWEPGVFAEFLNEAAEQLALLNGTPRMTRMFFKLPVIIVGYSGGYLPTAYALSVGGTKNRIRGIVLLDALYGELDTFEDWIAKNKSGFFISGYLNSTRARNLELKRMLSERKIETGSSLESDLRPGNVVFIAGGPDERHNDYVTQAWAPDPIADILNRLPDYRRREPPPPEPAAVAAPAPAPKD